MMKIVHLKKPDGRTRTIYVPSHTEKARLREQLPWLTLLARILDTHNVIHGFSVARSPVTNALEHVGYRYSVCFDLANFFDTVTPAHMPPSVLRRLGCTSLYFPDGAARQGLPTSPALANIAAIKMDEALVGLGTKYTRYADDMTFSTDDRQLAEQLLVDVPIVVREHGFFVNDHKTHLQCADAGRRIITGVAVDDLIHPRRRTKRRLRAAMHQRRHNQANDLAEWCKLKKPVGNGMLTAKVMSLMEAQ